jgi:hypothetical protein
MAYTAKVLVIANVTAGSDDLQEALEARAARGPVAVTLLMPATQPGLAGRDSAQPRCDEVVERWRAAGLTAEGLIGDADPVEAVTEIWDPRRFDEVMVSTLPGASSRWLQFDFPHRVARITDAPVTHVIARPPGHDEPHAGPPPMHEASPLGPLSVLSWGGRPAS